MRSAACALCCLCADGLLLSSSRGEQVPEYEYYHVPLRASSGAAITSSIVVDRTTRTFTGMAAGSADDAADVLDNPTDPTSLTEEQASRGVKAEGLTASALMSILSTAKMEIFEGLLPPVRNGER